MVLIATGLIYWDETRKDTLLSPNKPDTDEVCIQVITPARNPQTGEVRDFPTPCDVPEGWELVEPFANY